MDLAFGPSSVSWNQRKDKYDINEFFRTTSQPINISACRWVKEKQIHRLGDFKHRESKHFLSFLNKACHSDFEQTHTLYGNCYRFHPKETDKFLAPFGRQAGLSLILSFNESDWTSGWNHLLKGWAPTVGGIRILVCSEPTFVWRCLTYSDKRFLGATLFMTPEYEETLDPDDSITLNPNEIPLVTFRKRISHKLGPPYGNEVKSKPYYFLN